MTHTSASTHPHTHIGGPGLSAITAQWNIFRLERCRITLQPDDKYAVSAIINLVSPPSASRRSDVRGGKPAHNWMELTPQMALQRCNWCVHGALCLFYKTSGVQEVKELWVFGLAWRKVAGWNGWLADALFWDYCYEKTCKPQLIGFTKLPFFFFSYSYLISSIPSHSPAVLFAPASFFFLSTRLSAATLPSFLPRVFWHIDLTGISLEVSIVWLISSMHETPRLRGLRRQWSAHTQGQQHTLGTRVDLPSVA